MKKQDTSHAAGKGDAPRPTKLSVYQKNYTAIFRKKKNTK